MMIGDQPKRAKPTLFITPWTFMDEPASNAFNDSPGSGSSGGDGGVKSDGCSSGGEFSPYHLQTAFEIMNPYLTKETEMELDFDVSGREPDSPVDTYASDQFRMYDFKIKKCARGRSHDWTECPFAHPGEKARRRDPKRYSYSGTACADFRKGSCKKGDACEFSHGVFECWLHPDRYRTQPCKDGTSCRRRVCFFAHTAEQLRVLPQLSPRSTSSIHSYDGSPLRQAVEARAKLIPSSPPVSPPKSPMIKSINRPQAASLQLNKELIKAQPLTSWNVEVGSPVFRSPNESTARSGFRSLPDTPTRPALRYLDFWDLGSREEPTMKQVESGRDLRSKMLEKLRMENSVGCRNHNHSGGGGLDVGWISELLE